MSPNDLCRTVPNSLTWTKNADKGTFIVELQSSRRVRFLPTRGGAQIILNLRGIQLSGIQLSGIWPASYSLTENEAFHRRQAERVRMLLNRMSHNRDKPTRRRYDRIERRLLAIEAPNSDR